MCVYMYLYTSIYSLFCYHIIIIMFIENKFFQGGGMYVPAFTVIGT